jgi:DNA-binding transcriptional LysR family regulator
VPDINWLAETGTRPGSPRRALLEVNSLYAMAIAVRSGMGIGALPNWMTDELAGLVKVLPEVKAPKVDVFFVYPEELRNSKRVAVFRDYLLARLQELH